MRVTLDGSQEHFHSIYYREPGGVLFKIAANQPGFAVEEPAEQLGTKLMLPAHMSRARRKPSGFLQ